MKYISATAGRKRRAEYTRRMLAGAAALCMLLAAACGTEEPAESAGVSDAPPPSSVAADKTTASAAASSATTANSTAATTVYDVNVPVRLKRLFTADISPGNADYWESGVEYTRIIELNHSSAGENGTLLVTFEELNGGIVDPTGFPVYVSRDKGANWERCGFVTDPGTMSAQWNPQLFELPCPLGDLPAGTVLLAGVSLGSSRTAIVLYQSQDTGRTFTKLSTVAVGGPTGGKGIYEPFLVMLHDGTLVCHYSDETDSAAHSQKLSYRTTRDGKTWSEPVETVASPRQTDRPGMSVVTQLGDGRYFMVYEVVGREGMPIYCRTSADGLDWGDPADIGQLIESVDGKRLGSAPFCAWSPQGGKQGTLIVSGTFMGAGRSHTGEGSDYFISHDYGGSFDTVAHPIPYTNQKKFGYSNGFAFSSSGEYLFAVNNPGGDLKSDHSKITFALISLH